LKCCYPVTVTDHVWLTFSFHLTNRGYAGCEATTTASSVQQTKQNTALHEFTGASTVIQKHSLVIMYILPDEGHQARLHQDSPKYDQDRDVEK
jgi:hypothetical protein